MSWEHYDLALIKSWVPGHSELQTAGQDKQGLSVMQLWNHWKGIPWYQQGLTWLTACATPGYKHTHYEDTWHHTEAGDSRWHDYRPVLKPLPVSLLPAPLLLPQVSDSHLPIYRLNGEGDGFKWSDCSFLSLTMCKNLKKLANLPSAVVSHMNERSVGFPSAQLHFFCQTKTFLLKCA